MPDDYIDISELPKKERNYKVKRFVRDKKAALARFSHKVHTQIEAGRTAYQKAKAKATPYLRKMGNGLKALESKAKRYESKRKPKKRSYPKGDNIFGDLSLGGGDLFGSTPKKGRRSKRDDDLLGGMFGRL